MVGDSNSPHFQKFVRWFNKKHEVVVVSDKRSKGFGKVISVVRQIQKADCDIVHAHYACGYSTWAALSHKHPLIVSPWGSDIVRDPKESLRKKLMVKYALRYADSVSAVNEGMWRKLIELGCDPSKIEPLRISCVDTAEFHPYKSSLSVRHIYGSGPTILCARNPELESFATILDAIAIVVEKYPNVKLAIAHMNSEPDSFARIYASIIELNSHIMNLGHIQHHHMPEYLATANIFVDPFAGELALSEEYGATIGSASLEAMACGTPTIVMSANSEAPCLTCKPNCPTELADKILNLLEDEKFKMRIMGRQLQYVQSVGDLNIVMSSWEKEYKRLVRKWSKLENINGW
jgi:glycosyltransferase involved in cell wall biosynthesis